MSPLSVPDSDYAGGRRAIHDGTTLLLHAVSTTSADEADVEQAARERRTKS